MKQSAREKKARHGGAQRPAAPQPLKRGTRLTADLTIVDVIGFTHKGGLYLAARAESREARLVWESKSRRPAQLLGQAEEQFSRGERHYQVFPAVGVSLADMLETVGNCGWSLRGLRYARILAYGTARTRR